MNVFGNNIPYKTHPRALELVVMAGRIPVMSSMFGQEQEEEEE
jgi:hypothetical protein